MHKTHILNFISIVQKLTIANQISSISEVIWLRTEDTVLMQRILLLFQKTDPQRQSITYNLQLCISQKLNCSFYVLPMDWIYVCKCIMVQWVQVGGQTIPQLGEKEKEVGKLSSFLTPLDYRSILKKKYRIWIDTVSDQYGNDNCTCIKQIK